MAVLNHTIAAARDADATALFYADVLGLEPPVRLGHFAVVKVSSDGGTIDFVSTDGDIDQIHYAFLVTESEFDDIFERIQQRGLVYWADPGRSEAGVVNAWDDGRGLYFDDPNGHLLEIITRPYGSGGTDAEHPHPLLAPTIEPDS
ncbi:VOC family protein [Ilumatobacter nonamiensis]|uniref:VOC family protein n=1 Tax=Ilumatobacter nonamiensis TaxID=467093 RepID=UPI00058F9585|nr:VOC family protein [Ilumatobacter nonamiensis]